MFTSYLNHHSTVIVDGGLATELEARGYDLHDALWSAKILVEAPQAIKQVHLDYLWAGADVIISATYQATVAGFVARGFSTAEAEQLLRLAVQLAIEARDEFWAEVDGKSELNGRLRPLVAASVGPYGAYLANGAEYTGDYDLDEAGLVAFHRPRWHLLANSGADLLACETIPSAAEARALAQLLPETPHIPAWFCFSCGDDQHLWDGTPIAECAALLEPLAQVAAVGINCTAPRHLPGLIAAVQSATSKPIVVYPNSGETYDAVHNIWLGQSEAQAFGTSAREWRKLGAALIGGCCRTTPAHIRALSQRFRAVSHKP